MFGLSFYVLYQLNCDIIYKMSIIMEIRFLVLLHFLLATVRLRNHIMTLTVKIWNEAFILISSPFFLTFSWLFGEFQNFLATYQNLLTFSWLFKILTFSWLFPDLCGEPWPRQREIQMFAWKIQPIFFKFTSIALHQSEDYHRATVKSSWRLWVRWNGNVIMRTKSWSLHQWR